MPAPTNSTARQRLLAQAASKPLQNNEVIVTNPSDSFKADSSGQSTNAVTIRNDAQAARRRAQFQRLNTPHGMEYVNGQLRVKEGYEADPVTGFVLPTTEKALENFESEKYTLPASLVQGADQAATGITSTLDWLFGRPLQALGWENNPISALNEKLQSEKEQNRQYFAQKMEGDTSSQALSDIGTQVVAALPDALLAVLTAGGSVAAQATTKGLQAASAASKAATGNKIIDAASTAASALNSMVRNPQTWLSFSRVAGPSYDQAVYDGADNVKASAYAVINGLLNTIVEIGGGGIQDLPSAVRQGGNALRQWVGTMIDEGKEEAVQGVIERLTQNVVYGKDNPIYSTTDEDAVLNPVTSLKEAGMGALVGGILGGAQIGASNVLSSDASRQRTNAEIFAQESELNTQPQTTVETQAETTATQPRTVADIINSGNVSTNAANTIIENPQLKAEFEAISGTKLTGTKSEQRTFIKAYAAQMAQNAVAQTQQTVTPTEQATQAQTRPIAQTRAEAPGTAQQPQSVNVPQMAQQATTQEFNGQIGQTELPNSVGAAPAGFSPYTRAAIEYGTIPPGENPARAVDAPLQINETQKTGRTARTIMEAQATPESRIQALENAVMNGNFAYVTIANETLANNAAETVQKYGWDKALKDWTSEVRSGKANEQLAAMGATLINNAGNSGMSGTDYIDLVTDYNSLMHRLSRGLAAARILKTLTPEARLYGITRTVENMAREVGEKYNIQLDPDLIEQYTAATTDAERDNVITLMQQDIARQMPSTFLDKWTALRYTNMLGNFKTQVRNIAGNIISLAMQKTKNEVLAGMEYLASGISRGKYQRTRSLWTPGKLWSYAWNDFNLVRNEALGVGKYNDTNFQNEFERGVLDARTIFKASGTWGTSQDSPAIARIGRKAVDVIYKPLEAYRRITNRAMETGDMIFSRTAYADALAGYLKANGVSAEQFQAMLEAEQSQKIQQSENVPQEQTIATGTRVYASDRGNIGTVVGYDADTGKYNVFFKNQQGQQATVSLSADMLRPTYIAQSASNAKADPVTSPNEFLTQARTFAIKEAQEATFRDSNFFSDWVSKVARRKDTPKAIRVIAEGTMPFRKTTANILYRAEEYGPLGLINTAVKAAQAIKSSKDTTGTAKQVSGADVMNSLAKTLTGTGLVWLGWELAKRGLANGADDDDEKQAAFDDLTGSQPYSVVLPDGTNFPVDWAAPASIPFFTGVQLYNLASENGFQLQDIESAVTSITEPMLQMSMLQGVNDAIDDIKFSENNLIQLSLTSIANYLTQGLTNTLLGQIERTAEEYRQTTYTDAESPVPSWFQRIIGKASAKTPGFDYNQLPYVDAWGQFENNGTTAQKIIENFFSPFYIDKSELDKVEMELQRVYNATDGEYSVFPEQIYPSTKVDGEPLGGDDYVEYAQTRGQTSFDAVQTLINSSAYRSMTSNEKAEALEDVYSYAKAVAAESIGRQYSEGGGRANNAIDAENAGIDAVTFLLFAEAASNFDAKDASGQSVNGLKKERVTNYINSLDLTPEQKDYLYLSQGYSESGLSETPWN